MKYIRYIISYILSLCYDIYYFFFGNIKSRIMGLKYYKESKYYPDHLKRGNAMDNIKYSIEIK